LMREFGEEFDGVVDELYAAISTLFSPK
jgi:hypothetical protein